MDRTTTTAETPLNLSTTLAMTVPRLLALPSSTWKCAIFTVAVLSPGWAPGALLNRAYPAAVTSASSACGEAVEGQVDVRPLAWRERCGARETPAGEGNARDDRHQGH